MGQDSQVQFQEMWTRKELPFVGLPDEKERVAKLYHQQVKLLKLGRMPALFVVSKNGVVDFALYGKSMSDIPANEEVLAELRTNRRR